MARQNPPPKHLPLPFAVLIVLAVLLVVAGVTGNLARVENAGLDRLLYLNAERRSMPDDIVIIDIDQKSLEAMNDVAGSWPWPRAVHGELIEALSALGPKAIVFDILFNEADTFRPESDAYFASVLRQQPNVYLPTMLLVDGTGARFDDFPPSLRIEAGPGADRTARVPLLVPLVAPPETWRGGLVNFYADGDGIGRRYWLHRDPHGWRIPSMPARLADDLGWRTPAGDAFVLNWYGTVPARYSYSDVHADLTGSAPKLAHALRGKVIVIGAAAPGLGDLRPTPMGSTYQGLLIVATALGNLRDGDWLVDTRWGLLLYPVLLVPLLVAFRRRVGIVRIALTLAGATLLLAALEYALLSQLRVLVHAFAPLASAWLLFIALAVASWRDERRARDQAVAIFGRFLDPRVVKDLVAGGTMAEARATQAREISILFSDIRGFTTLSERSTPEQVVSLLNDYFSRQVKVIFDTHGTLDKFIGDAIMAFWGAPAEDPQHARHAVEAALDMVDVLLRFKQDHGAEGEHFDVGIGVHTGQAVVGFIGSQDRLDYTAIGDSVNLASRIEGATKGVARVLVSEFTMRACGDAFDFTDHGVVHVKGREQGVRLYEPHRKAARDAVAAGSRHDGPR